MAHSKSEGGKGPFHDDAVHDYLEDEAEDRAKVLTVLHELVGGERHTHKTFDVNLVAIRSGLDRNAVLAVLPTLHNFRLIADFDGSTEVAFDPDADPEEKPRWYQRGCARQNRPIRIQPQDGADERWGDDVVFPDLPEPSVSPMFTIDSS